MSGADLRAADLHDTDLNGADLRAAARLTQRQLGEACSIAPKLPTGLTLNKPCPLVRRYDGG